MPQDNLALFISEGEEDASKPDYAWKQIINFNMENCFRKRNPEITA